MIQDINSLEDGARENINGVDYSEIYKRNEELLKKYYEREDAIRKETQMREDTAYSRALNDMRNSGIDPNLIGINPSDSGGGISSATKQENTLSTIASNTSKENIENVKKMFEEYKFAIEQNFEITNEDRKFLLEQVNTGIKGADTLLSFIGKLL